MSRDNSTRREFLTRLGLGALTVGAASALVACGKKEEGGAAVTCTDPAGTSNPTRTSLKYVDVSPDPNKRCDNCQQYVAPEGGKACGGCKLFNSTDVAPKGYCNGWVQKTA